MAQGFTLILFVSMIIWYIVDRFKVELWDGAKYGRYITILLAAVLSFVAVFSFDLDVLYAAEMVDTTSVIGNVLTGLLLMSGSSAISVIIEKLGQSSSMTNVIFKDCEEEETIE